MSAKARVFCRAILKAGFVIAKEKLTRQGQKHVLKLIADGTREVGGYLHLTLGCRSLCQRRIRTVSHIRPIVQLDCLLTPPRGLFIQRTRLPMLAT
jgi:hypothetical protein